MDNKGLTWKRMDTKNNKAPDEFGEAINRLDEIKEEIFPEDEASYPYAEWERKREKVKQRLRNLPLYVEQAVDMIQFEKRGAGRPKKVNLVKRTMLFLFARLMMKSNRDVEDLLEMFEPLFGVNVSFYTNTVLLQHPGSPAGDPARPPDGYKGVKRVVFR